MFRFKELNQRIGHLRLAVQVVFFLTCIVIGVHFSLFVGELASGKLPEISRPPGVEAFLPISGLISLKYFFLTGVVNKVHPSGMLVFVFVCMTGLFLKRSFCSWVCPVGLLNDLLGRIHLRIFRDGVRIPFWLDVVLRGIKYLLLAFFLWTIVLKMDAYVLKQFIHSPFHILADVKMLKFFTEISSTALVVITLIVVASVFIRNFWCRYLCPYGALLGALSFISPFKIRRNSSQCTSCGKCDRACPASIGISIQSSVLSDECTACLRCVGTCPEKQALSFSMAGRKTSLSPLMLAFLLVLLFGGGSLAARVAGVWQNNISGREYLVHMVGQKMVDPGVVMKNRKMMEQMRMRKMP